VFDIITKEEYWGWVHDGLAPPSWRRPGARGPRPPTASDRLFARLSRRLSPPRPYELKDVQDAFILSCLRDAGRSTILEAGGGRSRILPLLAGNHECWTADRFEGRGRGPTRPPRLRRVHTVLAYMGEYDPGIPAETFDFVVSVSVVEHVPLAGLEAFFGDCARVLKPGGRMIHAIDTYLFDDADLGLAAEFQERIRSYLRLGDRSDLGLRWVEAPGIDEHVRFSCRYASVPDNVLHEWNLRRPSLKRAVGQVVSLKAQWVKALPESS
jgi:SAM-dependent methyltransferase